MAETENVDGFFQSNVCSSKFRLSQAKENGQAYRRNLVEFAVRQGQVVGHGTFRR